MMVRYNASTLFAVDGVEPEARGRLADRVGVDELVLLVQGTLVDGTAIEGSDCVVIREKGR